MSRVVIDTSVLVRYLIKPGVAIRELIEEHWLRGKAQLITAPELLEELEGVLHRDYIQALVQPAEAQTLLEAIRPTAEILPALGSIPSYSRDPKDDKFIACALHGKAEYVVTLDNDLLVVGSIGQTRMVTPSQFLALSGEA